MESAASTTIETQVEAGHSDLSHFVPILTQLNQGYQDVNGAIKSKHQPRYKNIVHRFKQLYGVEPLFFCRAPGRVNIIGEHIDYCGYSVLPAAIE